MKLPIPVQPTSADSTALRCLGRTGFTLVEILIVVVIVAILAAIVVPQFTSASDETRQNTIKMDLYRIRQQIEIYRQQHNSTWPAQEQFAAQMTQSSNAAGATASPGTEGYPFGPYIREVPTNPYTSGNTVDNVPVGGSDWYYDASTGEFRANNSAEHRAF